MRLRSLSFPALSSNYRNQYKVPSRATALLLYLFKYFIAYIIAKALHLCYNDWDINNFGR